jgi:hypothetical protein
MNHLTKDPNERSATGSLSPTGFRLILHSPTSSSFPQVRTTRFSLESSLTVLTYEDLTDSNSLSADRSEHVEVSSASLR